MTAADDGASPERSRGVGGGHRLRRRLRTSPLFWGGVGGILVVAIFCFVGPLFWPVNPLAIRPDWFLRPPGPGAPLGTDPLGRDELARLMVGGQALLVVAFVSAALATGIGAVVGIVAGYRRGPWDGALMWVSNVALGVPQLVPLMLVDALVTPSNVTMTWVVALTGWPIIARLVRAETLTVSVRDYVESARAMGAREARILWRHVLPALAGPLLIAFSFQIGTALLVVATASYLGLGLAPPWPNWGNMMADAVDALIAGNWWLVAPPAAAYAVLQISVNLAADGVREVLAPGGGP